VIGESTVAGTMTGGSRLGGEREILGTDTLAKLSGDAVGVCVRDKGRENVRVVSRTVGDDVTLVVRGE